MHRQSVKSLMPLLLGRNNPDKFASYLSRTRTFPSIRAYCSSIVKVEESYLNGNSSTYIEEMYEAWAREPKSVHASWDAYFRGNSFQKSPFSGSELGEGIPFPWPPFKYPHLPQL
ncbi:2oxoglutarate dehydrogenase_ mitochondriallike [Caligus rogercresseyi]|uniref:2oxoglutarate dehydrogenase_ mitochondriallike n=1 Tax=Caligus rogercresseyi TaxID=217165 RepID=A0A7T8K6X1_CALRO|nr:2oxoglutarate dehydrogenase_ mitochondriallike [Caligus rogercresseyi]